MAVYVQGLYVYSLIGSGGVIYTNSTAPPDFASLNDYPNTEDSELNASRVRTTAKMTCAEQIEKNAEWLNHYWRSIWRLTRCETPSDSEPEESHQNNGNSNAYSRLAQLAIELADDLNTELSSMLNRTQLDLRDCHRNEVLMGMLSRNALMFHDMTRFVALQIFPHVTIMMRCMLETLIRVKWYAERAKDEDFKHFMDFGLGQEKLYMEHVKKLAKEHPEDPTLEEIWKDRENWISWHKYDFMVQVDVGLDPTGKNIRDLAKDVGLEGMHRLSYSPFSSAVHGHWNTLAQTNMIPCSNPLHGFHYVPILPARVIQVDALNEAARLYDDSYRIVAKALLGSEESSAAAVKFFERGFKCD